MLRKEGKSPHLTKKGIRAYLEEKITGKSIPTSQQKEGLNTSQKKRELVATL